MVKINKTFIIRHKESKEIWTASSGKRSWKAIGHAKNAWVGSNQPEEFIREHRDE